MAWSWSCQSREHYGCSLPSPLLPKSKICSQVFPGVLKAQILGRSGKMGYMNYDFSRDILGWSGGLGWRRKAVPSPGKQFFIPKCKGLSKKWGVQSNLCPLVQRERQEGHLLPSVLKQLGKESRVPAEILLGVRDCAFGWSPPLSLRNLHVVRNQASDGYRGRECVMTEGS